MSGITNASKTLSEVAGLIGQINPLVGSGVALGKAIYQVFKARGDSEDEAQARAAAFEQTLVRWDAINTRIIEKGEAFLNRPEAVPVTVASLERRVTELTEELTATKAQLRERG